MNPPTQHSPTNVSPTQKRGAGLNAAGRWPVWWTPVRRQPEHTRRGSPANRHPCPSSALLRDEARQQILIPVRTSPLPGASAWRQPEQRRGSPANSHPCSNFTSPWGHRLAPAGTEKRLASKFSSLSDLHVSSRAIAWRQPVQRCSSPANLDPCPIFTGYRRPAEYRPAAPARRLTHSCTHSCLESNSRLLCHSPLGMSQHCLALPRLLATGIISNPAVDLFASPGNPPCTTRRFIAANSCRSAGPACSASACRTCLPGGKPSRRRGLASSDP
jgi:hypothetical protein